jgi:hypothetical protein
MGKYWRLMGEYDAETAAYTACVGANAPSPFTPIENAKLIGIRIIICGTAATSLVEGLQFKLTSTSFKPNAIEVGAAGNGLRTVPCSAQIPYDWAVDQAVMVGVPVTIEGRCTVGTAVTANVQVWGAFQS